MLENTIIPTKLHRPRISKEWVDRPALSQRLSAGLRNEKPVILVSAPAGFGKTSCISRWISTCEPMASAWVSLDQSDDDPGSFFTYFITALQTLENTPGKDVLRMIGAGEFPSAERIAAALAGDLITNGSPLLVVLDDFHVIQDPAILKTLEIIINNPPPRFHLAFITREDPSLSIARLRANDRLTEIRAADLKFNREEIQVFFNKVINLPLTEEDAELLEVKTEGWPAGLRLAALALRTLPDKQRKESSSEFISSLSGRHHYIGTYLTEQVLQHLSPELRDFLLKTSILTRLNAGACNAVTDRNDSARILEKLSSENIFLIPLDAHGQWYRYHHLFADLLQNLAESHFNMKELHRKAAYWYIQEDNIEASIEHAFASMDYILAAELLEKHATDLIMKGHVKTLDTWIQSLPQEQLSNSPKIHLAFAWMYVLRGDIAQAQPYLHHLQSIFADTDDTSQDSSLLAEWYVIRSLVLFGQNELENSLQCAETALHTAPADDHRALSLAYYAKASAYNAQKASEEAKTAYQLSLKSAVIAHNQIMEILSTAGLSVQAFEHGQLQEAADIILPVIEQLEKAEQQSSMSSVMYGVLAEIYYLWNRREEARLHMTKALRLSELGGYAGIIGCRIFLSRLHLLNGDVELATSLIREAVALIDEDTAAFICSEAAAQQVCCYLAEHAFDKAVAVLEPYGFGFNKNFRYPLWESTARLNYSSGLLYTSSLQVILQAARPKPSLVTEGIALADKIIASSTESHSILIAIQAYLLRACLSAAEDPAGENSSRVREDVIHALHLGQEEKVYTIFLEQSEIIWTVLEQMSAQSLPKHLSREFIKQLLHFHASGLKPVEAYPHSPYGKDDEAQSDLFEPLTGRELEILDCMTNGMKYQQIADSLYVSLNTVRFHIKSIYGKLAVDNRTKAIEKARRIGLL